MHLAWKWLCDAFWMDLQVWYVEVGEDREEELVGEDV